MLRVVGLASSVPFGHAAPFDPVNRRISIIVMNKRTEDAITKEASGVSTTDAADGQDASDQSPSPADGTPKPPQSPLEAK
jgi:chemotaxis protein MotB